MDIEREISEDKTRDEMDRLREQNAAMLEALKLAVPKLQASYMAIMDPNIAGQLDAVIVECQAAIAAAEQEPDNG